MYFETSLACNIRNLTFICIIAAREIISFKFELPVLIRTAWILHWSLICSGKRDEQIRNSIIRTASNTNRFDRFAEHTNMHGWFSTWILSKSIKLPSVSPVECPNLFLIACNQYNRNNNRTRTNSGKWNKFMWDRKIILKLYTISDELTNFRINVTSG